MANILIVDDDQQTIEFLSAILSSDGHAPSFLVETGYLFKKLEAIPVDLILLDINMPEVDGVTLLKQIKGHPRYGQISVIMVTGQDDEKVLSSCFELGAQDYIHKPIIKLELRARVNSALEVRHYIRQLAELNHDLEQKVKERTMELVESQERLQAILDNTTAVVYLKDTKGYYLLVNHRYEVLFHVNNERMVGKTDRDIFPRQMAEKFRANDRKVLETRAPIEFEEIVPQDDGNHAYLSVKFPLFNSNGEIYGICGISTDITERKRAEDSQKEFSKKLVESQEAERKRIAMELHDGLGQNLIIIRDRIKKYSSTLPEKSEAAGELDKISSLAIQSIEEAREISSNLRPPVLDQLGLEMAVESSIEKTMQSFAINISSSLKGIDGFFEKDMEINIYRIVQEGLTNIIKHSRADKAHVGVNRKGNSVIINITDNGIGFDAGKKVFTNGGGFGLQGINERVKMLGGELKVDSAPGRGATLKIRIKGNDNSITRDIEKLNVRDK